MPVARAFIDSNIILYAIFEDDQRKMMIARQLLGEVATVVSPQILLEITNVLTRRAGLGPLDAARLLRPFIEGEVIPATEQTVRESWRVADRYGFHIYDATVIASALGARCSTLYTEDLQHDQRIESVRVVNPFK